MAPPRATGRNAAVGNVLVAGAGLAGTATAIHLAAAGVTVDLIDVSETAAALGSGITLQGNALRELRALGVWEQVQAQGYASAASGCARPTRRGRCSPRCPTRAAAAPTCRPPAACRGPRSPASCSTGRRRRAPRIRLGTSVHGAAPGRRRRRRDLRRRLGRPLRPRRRRRTASGRRPGGCSASRRSRARPGMGIWRAFGPRPASVTRTDLIYGGPAYIAGYCPTGEDTLYAYIVEDAQDRSALSADGAARGHARPRRRLPRPVGRDPARADRPAAGQLHAGSRRTWCPRRGTAAGSC